MKKICFLIIILVSYIVPVKAKYVNLTPISSDDSLKYVNVVTDKLLVAATYENFYDADTKYYKCGKLERIPKGLPKFTNVIYKLVKVIVPIILVVMGMVDFLKAVVASDEKQMDTNPKNFMRRIGVAVLIYFVMTSVQLLVKVVGGNNQKSISSCFNCFINSEKKCKAYDYEFEKIKDNGVSGGGSGGGGGGSW